MKYPKVILMSLPWTISNNESTSESKRGINHDSKIGFEHIGLLYLETLLEKAGISTEVHDLGFKAFHNQRISLEECINIIKERKPDIVGFSPYFTSIDDTLYVAEQIKELCPNIKIILGGPHASHTAKEILEDKPFIDTIFLGEAFDSIVPGIEALLQDSSLESVQGVAFRNNKHIINNGWGQRISLDKLPIPTRSNKMYTNTKTASMMFAKGCPAACTFCSAESLRDRSWRSRSPDNLIEEIDYLTNQFGIEVIETHSDDGFGIGSNAIHHYTAFAQKLINGNYKIKWRSVLRATDFREKGVLLSEDFWDLLHQSGLEKVFIGFEGGTNERLRKIKKPATVESNLRAFRFLTERGIAVQYGFIMFFPDSTIEEIQENLDFLYELRDTTYSTYSSSLIIHPGSAYFDTYKTQGRLQQPYYGIQPYEFSDPSIKQIRSTYHKFVHDQEPIDTLCNDVAYAIVWGNDSVLHLDYEVKVDPTMLEKRAKDLHSTGKKVIQNPEKALITLGEFNEHWRNEYSRYLKENARAT